MLLLSGFRDPRELVWAFPLQHAAFFHMHNKQMHFSLIVSALHVLSSMFHKKTVAASVSFPEPLFSNTPMDNFVCAALVSLYLEV